jgi:RNA polymerase sigma-70 factor (ECF subfamily)
VTVQRLDVQRASAAAVESLPLEQREVITLAYYSGMSHTEIAAHLQLPLGTVKTRARLAMMRLRDILEGTHAAGRDTNRKRGPADPSESVGESLGGGT